MPDTGMDWLVAWDDLLTHRLTHCTTCGSDDVVSSGIGQASAIVIAYVVCAGCHRQGKGHAGALAVLEQRYEV